jgi:hypothetical protein
MALKTTERLLTNIDIAQARQSAQAASDKVAWRLFVAGIVSVGLAAAVLGTIYNPTGWPLLLCIVLSGMVVFLWLILSYVVPERFYGHLVDLDKRRGWADIVQGQVQGRYKRYPSETTLSFLTAILSFGWNFCTSAITSGVRQKDFRVTDVVAETVKEQLISDAKPGAYWDMSSDERMNWEMMHPNVCQYFLDVANRKFEVDVHDWYRVAHGDMVRVHFMANCGKVLMVDIISRNRPESD